MSSRGESGNAKKSTVYIALITAIAIIIGSVILGLNGSNTSTSAKSDLPNAGIGANNSAEFSIITNLGEIVIETFPDKAPLTVNALASLAQDNYFNNTICHRLTTEGIFVLQCGDPTGTGTGGPDFNIPDENLPQPIENNYPAGTVAMANAGPGTSGSQFFLVYQDTTLGPNYSIWGKITKGLQIVQSVASQGVNGGGSDGAPAQSVTIESVAVTIS
ncbi:MAG: peptidylprolyl isomerase [Candidatus Nanopelagicales bacterium]